MRQFLYNVPSCAKVNARIKRRKPNDVFKVLLRVALIEFAKHAESIIAIKSQTFLERKNK